MSARKPSHLVRRGDIFYFRSAIPAHARGLFSRLEIKVSLRTTDRSQATLRQRWLSYLWEDILQAVRSMAVTTPFRIDQAVQQYFREQVEELALHAAEDPRHPTFEIDRELADANQFLTAIRSRIASRQYSPRDVDGAMDVLKKSSLDIPPKGSDFLDDVCNKTLRARAEAIRIFIALLEGRHDESRPKDPLFITHEGAAPSHTYDDVPKQKSMEELTTLYVEDRKGTWGEKTILDKIRVNKFFLQSIDPTIPASQVTPDMVRDFKSLLLKLPSNLRKHNDLRDLPLRQAIKKGEERELPKIHLRTAEKYMEMLKTFFEWACDEQYLPVNPVGRISIAFERSKADRPRNSYKIEQLNQLFSSPLYAGHLSAAKRHKPGSVKTIDGQYWLPLIALFSGMRSGEIIQLEIRDVRQVEGFWVFDINKGEDGTKSVKTASSIRQVPVHPKLQELGFLNYVTQQAHARSPDERLFSEIVVGKAGDPSHAYSKHYGRYTRRIGIKTEKTTFHSFRHGFVDALRAAGVQEYVFESLTGHSRGKVSSSYGSAGVPLKLKHDAIALVNYPGLNLGHLTLGDLLQCN